MVCGTIAQLAEQEAFNFQVVGSSPTGPTVFPHPIGFAQARHSKPKTCLYQSAGNVVIKLLHLLTHLPLPLLVVRKKRKLRTIMML